MPNGYWNAHSDLDWYNQCSSGGGSEEWEGMWEDDPDEEIVEQADTCSPYIDLPRRSLSEMRYCLLMDRLGWMSWQLEAEVAGRTEMAAYYGDKVETLTARLRMLDEEIADRRPGLGMVM